jgi:hypothetical protein
MKKKNNKKRKSSKSYEKPINSYLKKYFNGGQMFDAAAGAGSQIVMGMATDAVSNMIATAMGKSSQPKIFDFSENQNPIMAKGGIVEGDPPYKKVGNYQTSFHPKDMAYFEKMQKRFPEAYEASKSQYLLPGIHEVGTESVYKDDSYNPVMKTDNIVNEDKYIIKSSGGNYIPRTANQYGMHNFDIKDDQIMMPRLGRLNKAEFRRFLGKEQKKYAKGTGMQGVQNDPPPRKSLGKYTARVSPQDQKFYDRIQKKATPEAWQAIQGQFMTPGEYDLGQEDVYEGYDYDPISKSDNVTAKPKYFATSGDYEYPQSIINDQKGLSNYNVTEDGFLDVAPLDREGKKAIRTSMRKYAKGGVIQAPIAEVEDGEAYEKPNGEVGVFVGDKHGQDTDGDGFEGIPVTEQEVPEGTKIFSDQLGMAKKKLDREKEKKKQQEDLKENPTIFEKNTYKRGEEIRALKQKADEQIQEAANMMDQGKQMANDLSIMKQKYGGMMRYMKNGGTFKYKYANGGNVFGQLFGLATSAAEDLKGDDTPVEPPKSSYKESFKMPKGKIDPLYDNWKDKQTALGGGMDNSNAFNTNLNLGMGDVNAGFQYNIPKSNSYIKGNLNQQLTPLFTEGRVPTPTGSLEGYYGGNNFDITGKLNTDFQNLPTGSIGVNSNPSDKLSTYGNLNLGEDFGMNAGLNWNPSDKFSTGLDLNVNKEGLGIEGTGEYKVNPNLTLGATGRYNTGEGFTGDANLRYTFDRNKKEKIPTAFGKGGMIPKYQHGGTHGDPPQEIKPLNSPNNIYAGDIFWQQLSNPGVYNNSGDVILQGQEHADFSGKGVNNYKFQLPTNEIAPITQRNIPFNQVVFPGAKNPYLDLSGIQGTTDVKPVDTYSTKEIAPITVRHIDGPTGPFYRYNEIDPIKVNQIEQDIPEELLKADVLNLEETPYTTDESDTSGYNFTMGDMMGFAGTGIGGTAPMLTTLMNRAGDTPNINAYLNYGKQGLAEQERLKGLMGGIRDENLRDIGLKSDTQRKIARSGARGINQLRAFEQMANAQEQEMVSNVNAKYAEQMAGISKGIAGAMDARDRMTMMGREKQDLADRQDRDNFFTQLNQDFGSMGTAMQKMGKDLNVKQLDKDFMNILPMMNKYSIGVKQDKDGTFKMYNKSSGKFLSDKEQKDFYANLREQQVEVRKAQTDAKKYAEKEAKKQNLPVTDMGYQSLLLGNQTGVNTNAFDMNRDPNRFSNQFGNLFGTSKKKIEVGGVSEMDKYLKDKKPVNPVLKTDVGDGNDYIRGRLNFENKGGSFSGGGVSNYGFTGGGGSAKGTAMKEYFDASKGANKGEKAVNAVNNYIIGTNPEISLKGGNTSIITDLDYTRKQFDALPEHVKEEMVDWKLNTGRGTTDLLLNALDPKIWSGVDAAAKTSPKYEDVRKAYSNKGKSFKKLTKEDLRKARMRLYKGRIKYLKDKYGEKDNRYLTAKKGFENSQQYR